MKVEFSPAAQADLIDIAVFIAQDNPTRALTFVDDSTRSAMPSPSRLASASPGPNWAMEYACCRTGDT